MRSFEERKNVTLSNSNIPVLLIGFNRPKLIAKRLRELSAVPNLSLIISIDGGAGKDIEIEMNQILQELDKYKIIDSNVQIIQHSLNMGLAEHVTKAIGNVLEKHESVIVIEDDISVSRNFYNNMVRGMLDAEIRNDIATVGGYSAIDVYGIFKVHNKFRETKYFNAWGWGIRNEIWRLYKLDISERPLEEQLSNSYLWKSLSEKQRMYWIKLFEKVEKNPKLTWDIQMQFMCFKYELRNFLPLKSLIINEGFGDNTSTNTKELKPWWMPRKSNNELIQDRAGRITNHIYEELCDSIFMASDKTNLLLIILAKRISKAVRTVLKHGPF